MVVLGHTIQKLLVSRKPSKCLFSNHQVAFRKYFNSFFRVIKLLAFRINMILYVKRINNLKEKKVTHFPMYLLDNHLSNLFPHLVIGLRER